MSDRPAIPADLKRRILVESGHRCAIPTCRHPTTEIAHIVPYAEVKEHTYANLIALCPNCHTRYDRGEIDRKTMRIYKRKIAFLSDRYSKFELNVLDHLRLNPRVSVYGILQVKNLLDDGLIQNAHTISSMTYPDEGTQEVQEFVAVLTEKGRTFLEEWHSDTSQSLTYDAEQPTGEAPGVVRQEEGGGRYDK